MLNKEMKVSVVIPFYDNIEWLREAVTSVIMQTYENLEIIIVNDGSLFNLYEISQQDSRIKVVEKENGGPASARNAGIIEATGEFIAFLDSDDIWMKDKIQIQLSFMLKNSFKWSHHSYEMFKGNPDTPFRVVKPTNCEGDVLTNTYLSFRGQTSSFMVERHILLNNNIFFPEEKRYGQDIVFFRELAKREKLGFINTPLSKFRIRGNNAGFRPEIQIQFRFYSGQELKELPDIKNTLPKSANLGYTLNETLYKLIDKVEFTKYLYFIPYILFQMGSKKYEKNNR